MFYWVLFFVLAVQGFFLVAILAIKLTKSNRSLRWIVLITFLISIQLLSLGLGYSGQYFLIGYLFGLPQITPLLFGPLFYLFVKEQKADQSFSSKQLIYLSPSVLYIFINHDFFWTTPAVKAEIFEAMFNAVSTGHYLSSESLIDTFLLVGVNVFFWVKFRVASKDEKENPMYKNILVFFGFYILGLTLYRFSLFFGVSYHSTLCYLVKLYMGVCIYIVAYRFITIQHLEDVSTSRAKYSSNTLSDKRKEQIWVLLEDYIFRKSKFLNSDLKLSKISDELNISPNYISQVINEQKGVGFNRFINEARVEYSKRLLLESDLKIYAVALESGFGNKSTFNQEFKRFVGCTPSKFRNQQIKGQ